MIFLDLEGLQKYTAKVLEILQGFVPVTRKINGKPLTSDITTHIAGDGVSIEDDTINLDNPMRGFILQEDFDALPEEEKNTGTYIIPSSNDWTTSLPMIEEYDTENGWHVRKWPGGYVEMFYSSDITVEYEDWASASSDIGWAADNIFPSVKYPEVLEYLYNMQYSVTTSGHGYGAFIAQSKNVADMRKAFPACALWRFTRPAAGSKTYVLHLQVSGRRMSTNLASSASTEVSSIATSAPDFVLASGSTAIKISTLGKVSSAEEVSM